MLPRVAKLVRRLGLVAAILAASPAIAAPSAAFISAFQLLGSADARLNTIGFRLASANAAYCKEPRPSSGLLLTDVATYSRPADVREILRIKGDIAVQAVAIGSPAERAGLRPGDEVLMLSGLKVDAAGDGKRNSDHLNRLNDALEAALVAKGAARLVLERGPVEVGGTMACRARFELTTDGKGARAGRLIVQVSRAMLAETQSDDDAAFVVSHELAHVILGHSRAGRNAEQVRADEREADRLAPWLMANAGYDPNAALLFIAKWGGRGLRMFGDGTHASPKLRMKMLGDEVTAIAAMPAGPEGKRDWRARFGLATTAP